MLPCVVEKASTRISSKLLLASLDQTLPSHSQSSRHDPCLTLKHENVAAISPIARAQLVATEFRGYGSIFAASVTLRIPESAADRPEPVSGGAHSRPTRPAPAPDILAFPTQSAGRHSSAGRPPQLPHPRPTHRLALSGRTPRQLFEAEGTATGGGGLRSEPGRPAQRHRDDLSTSRVRSGLGQHRRFVEPAPPAGGVLEQRHRPHGDACALLAR